VADLAVDHVDGKVEAGTEIGDCGGGVVVAVVDEDHLAQDAGREPVEAHQQLRDVPGLVTGRNDQRDGSHGPVYRRCRPSP
jgi:hypothetical protein